MRRYVGLVLAVVGAFVALTAAPLRAEGNPPGGPQVEVSGSFAATGHFESGCNFLRHLVDGEGVWRGLGPSEINLDLCPLLFSPTPPWGVEGTFTITTPAGSLSGDVGGTLEGTGLEPQMNLALTVTAGTGRFSEATGSFAITGPLPFEGRPADGTIDGTVTLRRTTPTSRADCRMGGWRNYVDEEGKPFRSRGNCTAFVDRLP